MQIILGFLGIVALLWFVWFMGGGVERYEREHPGKFLKPPAPLDSGATYN